MKMPVLGGGAYLSWHWTRGLNPVLTNYNLRVVGLWRRLQDVEGRWELNPGPSVSQNVFWLNYTGLTAERAPVGLHTTAACELTVCVCECVSDLEGAWSQPCRRGEIFSFNTEWVRMTLPEPRWAGWVAVRSVNTHTVYVILRSAPLACRSRLLLWNFHHPHWSKSTLFSLRYTCEIHGQISPWCNTKPKPESVEGQWIMNTRVRHSCSCLLAWKQVFLKSHWKKCAWINVPVVQVLKEKKFQPRLHWTQSSLNT